MSKIKSLNFRQSLFWDIDPKSIDLKKHRQYIIERILDFGTDREVQWVRKKYSPQVLKKIVISSRSLSPKSKNFWAILLNLNRNKWSRKFLTKRQNKIWPF